MTRFLGIFGNHFLMRRGFLIGISAICANFMNFFLFLEINHQLIAGARFPVVLRVVTIQNTPMKYYKTLR